LLLYDFDHIFSGPVIQADS